MVDVIKRKKEFFAYKNFKNCPSTNNIIEAYNSHLTGRLKTIKGFDSYTSAKRWLNAWMIRRRTKNFTDCQKSFKHLNGKCSLEKTLKKDQKWPLILGVKSPKNQPEMKR
jgi:transposase-like protein